MASPVPDPLPMSVVEPLCQPFARQADCLLDLYAMTQEPVHPGRCVQCFFRLLGQAQGAREASLTPLKRWIEDHVEISVQAEEAEAARLPVDLRAFDLEDFCQQAIEHVRRSAVTDAADVHLYFTCRRVG